MEHATQHPLVIGREHMEPVVAHHACTLGIDMSTAEFRIKGTGEKLYVILEDGRLDVEIGDMLYTKRLFAIEDFDAIKGANKVLVSSNGEKGIVLDIAKAASAKTLEDQLIDGYIDEASSLRRLRLYVDETRSPSTVCGRTIKALSSIPRAMAWVLR